MALLLPTDSPMDSMYPAERLAVGWSRPGDAVVTFEGIPVSTSLHVRVFADCGIADSGAHAVLLRAGASATSTFALVWKWPASGTVRSKGSPVAGAKVTVETMDIGAATGGLLREVGGLDRIALPVGMWARKVVETDGRGAFRVETADVPRGAILAVETPDGDRWGAVLPEGPKDFGDIELTRPEEPLGPASLVIDFGGAVERRLRVTRDGKPEPERSFSQQTLEIADLAPGLYTMRVRVGGELVESRDALRVRGATKVLVDGK